MRLLFNAQTNVLNLNIKTLIFSLTLKMHINFSFFLFAICYPCFSRERYFVVLSLFVFSCVNTLLNDALFIDVTTKMTFEEIILQLCFDMDLLYFLNIFNIYNHPRVFVNLHRYIFALF